MVNVTKYRILLVLLWAAYIGLSIFGIVIVTKFVITNEYTKKDPFTTSILFIVLIIVITLYGCLMRATISQINDIIDKHTKVNDIEMVQNEHSMIV